MCQPLAERLQQIMSLPASAALVTIKVQLLKNQHRSAAELALSLPSHRIHGRECRHKIVTIQLPVKLVHAPVANERREHAAEVVACVNKRK